MDEKEPQAGCYLLLVFTDASCGEDVIGLGYIIRVNGQEYKGSTYIEGDYTSMEAEYLALKEAVQAAEWIRDTDSHLNLYTDCDPLARKMTQKNGCAEWNKRYDEFHELASDWAWHINWIPRTRNREADELASLGLRKGRDATA